MEVSFFRKASGVELEKNQLQKLQQYVEQLCIWNQRYNLVAQGSKESIISHVEDCLYTQPILKKYIPSSRQVELLDYGTGAGLPGLVFAICNPEVRVTCLDKVGKKIAFVQHCINYLHLNNVSAVQKRIENVSNCYDVVVTRAVATLEEIVLSTNHVMKKESFWFCLKGKEKTINHELSFFKNTNTVFHVEQVDTEHAVERNVVIIQNMSIDEMRIK